MVVWEGQLYQLPVNSTKVLKVNSLKIKNLPSHALFSFNQRAVGSSPTGITENN